MTTIKPLAEIKARSLAGYYVKELTQAQLEDLWRLQLAGYLHVWTNGFIVKVRGQ